MDKDILKVVNLFMKHGGVNIFERIKAKKLVKKILEGAVVAAYLLFDGYSIIKLEYKNDILRLTECGSLNEEIVIKIKGGEWDV